MDTTSLNKFAAEIHNGNKQRGFYDDPKEIGTQLMLIVSELSEALEADRLKRHSDVKEYLQALKEAKDKFGDKLHGDFDIRMFKKIIKDTFEDEIADAFIRLFDLVGWLNIDIDDHIYLKLNYNATRGYKHGKEY